MRYRGLVALAILAIAAVFVARSDSTPPEAAQILKTTVTLSSAQILTLADTPVQIIPAPGAGKFIAPLYIDYDFKAGSSPYVINPPEGEGIFWGWGDARNWANRFRIVFNIESTVDQSNMHSPPADLDSYHFDDSAIANQPVTIAIDLAPTGGNGTLRVTCYYVVVDL